MSSRKGYSEVPGLGLFASLGSIEKDPRRKVVREILKSMDDTCRNEQNLSRSERVAFASVDEYPCPGDHDIDFVPGMGLLPVDFVRTVIFDFQRSVFEELDELAAVTFECPQGFIGSEVVFQGL